MDELNTRPSTPGLIGDAIRHASSLVTAELQLVRLEATEKVSSVVAALVSLVVAAVFIIVALIFLLEGVVETLVHFGWDDYVASFAVGGAIALVAVITLVVALRRLSGDRLKPQRSIRQVQQAVDVVKGAR